MLHFSSNLVFLLTNISFFKMVWANTTWRIYGGISQTSLKRSNHAQCFGILKKLTFLQEELFVYFFTIQNLVILECTTLYNPVFAIHIKCHLLSNYLNIGSAQIEMYMSWVWLKCTWFECDWNVHELSVIEIYMSWVWLRCTWVECDWNVHELSVIEMYMSWVWFCFTWSTSHILTSWTLCKRNIWSLIKQIRLSCKLYMPEKCICNQIKLILCFFFRKLISFLEFSLYEKQGNREKIKSLLSKLVNL